MKTLTKIALTTLLMGTGLALAAQPQQQANDVNAAPAQTQSMGSMMSQGGSMMGGHMAHGQSAAPKQMMKKSGCNRHAYRHMNRQNMMDGRGAPTDSTGSKAG